MLKAEKVWYFSPQAGPYGQAGIPDRIGVLTGLFFAVECKADATKKMTALQELCKEKIEAAGGKFFLVYDKATIEEVRQWIVGTRSRRQEGGSSGVGEPASHYHGYSDSEVSEEQFDARTALYREYPTYAEFRARYTESDSTLL